MLQLLSLRKCALLGVITLCVGFSRQLLAAPVIQQHSGAVVHSSNITISGASFGVKNTASPVVWDDATGASITSKWTGGYPNSSTDSNAIMQYRPVGFRGVAGPHAFTTNYAVGAHCCGTAANTGIDVMLFKARTMNSFPQYTYASWYERVDPAWVTTGPGMVNNYKTWDYSYTSSPYSGDWHLNHTFGTNFAPSGTNGVNCQVNDNASTLTRPSYPNWYGQGPEPWIECLNPIFGGWRKYEVEIKYTTATDGFIRLITNGNRNLFNVMNIRTDSGAGTSRSEAIGGYTGWYQISGGANLKNFRYYTDIYLDYTLQRVVLANNSDLAHATIIEPQIPSAWSDTSITATVNLGRLSAGQTAYLFVVDPQGQWNLTGFPVTIGTSAGNPSPPPITPAAISPASNLR